MNLVAARSQIDALNARINKSRQCARRYLLGCQSPTGGFCFYRSEYLDEANLFDTWHAVAALTLLSELPPHRAELVNFVFAQPPSRQPYALYYRIFILKALGSSDPDHAVIEKNVRSLVLKLPNPTQQFVLSWQMETLLLTLRLKVYYGIMFPAQDIAQSIVKLEQPNGGFGATPNLLDTQLALEILALLDQTTSTRTPVFVAHLEGPGYAFRLTERSLSPHLETVCAGIECCQRLNLPVGYPEDAATFILACQTSNGGFARAPGALPNIEFTHLALQGLASLFENVLIHNPN